MDDVTRSILKSVESGKYFEDARTWYNSRYLNMYHDRALLTIFTSILVIIIIFLTTNYFSLLPTSSEAMYYLSKNYDDGKYYRALTLVSDENNITQKHEDFVRKVAANYVRLYEKYDYSMINIQFQNLYKMSTKNVFEKFYNNMSLENPDSPLHYYGRYREKNIYITSLNLLPKGGSSYKAIVEMVGIISGPDIAPIQENKKIEFDFDISDIEKLTDNTKYYFVVTDYKTLSGNK